MSPAGRIDDHVLWAEAFFDGMPGFFPPQGDAAFQHEVSVLHRPFITALARVVYVAAAMHVHQQPVAVLGRHLLRLQDKSLHPAQHRRLHGYAEPFAERGASESAGIGELID